MKTLTPQGNNRVRRVAALLDVNRNWKESAICQIFLPVDAACILKIKTSNRFSEDVIAWQPEKNGRFTVRSAYQLGLKDTPEQRSFPTSSSNAEGTDVC
jgi:hypothetical protein